MAATRGCTIEPKPLPWGNLLRAGGGVRGVEGGRDLDGSGLHASTGAIEELGGDVQHARGRIQEAGVPPVMPVAPLE